MKNKFKKIKLLLRKNMQGSLLAAILFFSVAIITIHYVDLSYEKSSDEQLNFAKESISKAAITCYAIEGRYPESYDYIKDNYGVRINEDKYAVFYEIFAENIMPDITVIERQGEK